MISHRKQHLVLLLVLYTFTILINSFVESRLRSKTKSISKTKSEKKKMKKGKTVPISKTKSEKKKKKKGKIVVRTRRRKKVFASFKKEAVIQELNFTEFQNFGDEKMPKWIKN